MMASIINEVASQTTNRRNYQMLRSTRISFEPVATPEALKRAYVDTFFDQVPIGAVLSNDSGMVLAINAHVTSLLKLQESDILGKSIFAFFPDHEKNKLEGLLPKQDTDIREEIVERSVGESQYIRIIVSSIKDMRFSNFKSILLTDVTERMTSRKRIEEQLEELNASNEELKKVNADLDSFIYTASHDLKAPVSNIEGLIHSLRDSLVSEYERIKPETEILLGMIDQSVARFQETLLDLTEVIKTQRVEGEDIKVLSCAYVIESVVLNLQEEVKNAGGEIKMHNAPGCTINFSKKNFRSIVYNLISNAIKYRSPDRKLKIFIKTEVIQDFIILTVQDNGLGISEDNVSRMFTMFKRFHDHVEGTVIGLYIVKRIIDNSGGKIEVDSELGKGTTFRVYFKA